MADRHCLFEVTRVSQDPFMWNGLETSTQNALTDFRSIQTSSCICFCIEKGSFAFIHSKRYSHLREFQPTLSRDPNFPGKKQVWSLFQQNLEVKCCALFTFYVQFWPKKMLLTLSNWFQIEFEKKVGGASYLNWPQLKEISNAREIELLGNWTYAMFDVRTVKLYSS